MSHHHTEHQKAQQVNTGLSIFPWQTQQWQQLAALFEQQQFPHALLLKGPKGVGKLTFARSLAKLLLCQAPIQIAACNHCQTCYLFNANTHPDFQQLQPENQKMLKVDDIRLIVELAQQTTRLGNYKVIIIEPAEAMNMAAANALLKTLEEPYGNTLLFLVSHQPDLLPATIRSRCQSLNLFAPARELALAWLQPQLGNNDYSAELLLKLTEFAPLRALTLVKSSDWLLQRTRFLDTLLNLLQGKTDPIASASIWANHPVDEMIYWLLCFTTDLIRIVGKAPEDTLINIDIYPQIQHLHMKFNQLMLFQLLDHLYQLQQQLNAKINLNALLLLEDTFSRFAHRALCVSS